MICGVKKEKYIRSFFLECSMLIEMVACAELLAEVGGKWRTFPLLPITLRIFYSFYYTDSPPSADYLEELRMDRGRGGGEEVTLRNMMWVYKIAFMSIT